MKQVAVIGAGTMGHSLALVHGLGGCKVRIFDKNPAALGQAKKLIKAASATLLKSGVKNNSALEKAENSIDFCEDIKICLGNADLVIEAVVEDEDVKKAVFDNISDAAPNDAVIASNTSYLDIFPLLPGNLRSRTLIAHWYTPPYIIDLVDIAPGPDTDPIHLQMLRELYDSFGKAPLVFDRLIQGYIANRLQSALNLECLRMIDEGWVGAEDIDFSIRYGLVERLAVLGHMRKMDYTGIEMVRKALASRAYSPPPPTDHSPTLDELVKDGRTGVMAGAGHYDYGDKSPEKLFESRDLKLLEMKKAIKRIVGDQNDLS